MDTDVQKALLYLLHHLEYYITENVYNVLEDSQTDPHYSAVTTTNLIKNYILVMESLGCELPYQDVEGFFEQNILDKEEYAYFEKLRKKEATYYIGEIF